MALDDTIPVPPTGGGHLRDRQVRRYTSTGHAEIYELDEYADLGAALQAAHDDALAEGQDQFIAEVSGGQYTVTTPVTVEMPPYIVGQGDGDYWGGGGGTVVTNDTGGYWLTLRGTSNSPDTDRINHGLIKGFLMNLSAARDPYGAVYMDGTTAVNANGSIVRGVTFEDVHVAAHGDVALAYDGTVFDISFNRVSCKFNSAPAVGDTGSGVATAGPASQFQFYDCYLFGYNGTYAIAPAANSTAVIGGSVSETAGGNGLDFTSCSGCSVVGTHMEGADSTGTVGILHNDDGPSWYRPTVLSRWDTGLQIGDGTTNTAQYARISFPTGGGNTSEDVLVTAGGKRANTIFDAAALYTITDNRETTDGVNETFEWSLTAV